MALHGPLHGLLHHLCAGRESFSSTPGGKGNEIENIAGVRRHLPFSTKTFVVKDARN